MYDELVKRLRTMADWVGISFLEESENVRTNLSEAADAIEEAEMNISHLERDYKELCSYLPKWIPVTERLPEEEQPVLVVRKFLGVKGQVPPSVYVEIAERIGEDWCADSDEYKIARSRHTNPTHWMPLPEPPEEETC